MAKKKYTKIKHNNKRFYKKRRSPVATVLGTIGMVVIIGAMVFVGFSVAGPIFDFFKNDDKATQTEGWTPQASVSTDNSSGSDGTGTTSGTGTSDTSVDTESPEIEDKAINAYTAPDDAVTTEAKLKSALAAAKDAGCGSIVLLMKDETGNVLYKSSYSEIKDSDLIKGKLTLKAIVAACDKEGIKPIAKINTLMDSLAYNIVSDSCYYFKDGDFSWLDDYAERGGKHWSNPFSKGTQKYMMGLTAEFSKAGIDNVIYSNLLFPELSDYDITVLDKEVIDTKNRYSALVNIVTKGSSKSTSPVIIEMDAKSVIENYAGFTETAEVLNGASGISDNPIEVVFNKSNIGKTIKTGEDETAKLPTDISKLVKDVFTRVNDAADGLKVIPCLEGLSENDLEKAKAVLNEMGYTDIIIK